VDHAYAAKQYGPTEHQVSGERHTPTSQPLAIRRNARA
jgi:hypothetical protein